MGIAVINYAFIIIKDILLLIVFLIVIISTYKVSFKDLLNFITIILTFFRDLKLKPTFTIKGS
jgi:hypothetical protein